VRVRVDQLRCRGHALCFGALPQVFRWDDADDRAFTNDAPVSPALETDVLAARDACPEQAIVVES
jgi:ferredoxin